jgi:hypothetical protein
VAVTIHGTNLSEAWLASMEHLLAIGGKEIHLITVIDSTAFENLAVRRRLDEFLAVRQSRQNVSTVANTIFPASLYLPHLGEAAQDHLYTMHREGDGIRRRLRRNRSVTYFDRLTAWPGNDGPYNQLQRVIERIGNGERRNPLSSAYELALTVPATDTESTEDLRIYTPGTDNSTMGFPCLSHISLTSTNGSLHMTAMYRNQHFLRKAYGNYVGLSRLLGFLSHETDLRPGELMCIATHADAEIRQDKGFGKREVSALIEGCREALSTGEQTAMTRPVLPALHPLRCQAAS